MLLNLSRILLSKSRSLLSLSRILLSMSRSLLSLGRTLLSMSRLPGGCYSLRMTLLLFQLMTDVPRVFRNAASSIEHA
jgi:hypothetical protein